jgi:hypothetical protein
VGAQTDPSLLWEYQIERRRQWDALHGFVGLFALVAPICLAIVRSELPQILKIIYFFFAFFFAVMVDALLSATSFFSAVLSLAACFFYYLAFFPALQWIYKLNPKPEWYVSVIPILIVLNITIDTLIPQKERSEWRWIKANVDFSDHQLQLLAKEKGIASPAAKKVYENICKTKPETISEKIIDFLMRHNRRSSRHQIATTSGEKTGPIIKPLPTNTYSEQSNQLKPKWSSNYYGKNSITIEAPQLIIQQNQSNGQMEELHELQRQAEETLKKLKGFEPQGTILIVDPATEIAAFFQDAFNHNDRSALQSKAPEEMNVTTETEIALANPTANVTTRLEIVKGGGSYLLIHQGEKHWLIPTFPTLRGFLNSQPSRGIFSYARESVDTVELRRPAEVKEVGGVWEVVNMGVVAVRAQKRSFFIN